MTTAKSLEKMYHEKLNAYYKAAFAYTKAKEEKEIAWLKYERHLAKEREEKMKGKSNESR